MQRRLILVLGIALVLYGTGSAASALRIVRSFPVENLTPPPSNDQLGPRGFAAIDPATERLYLSDGAGKLVVVDIGTGGTLATLNVGGTVYVNAVTHRVYVVNDTTVTVLDGTDYTVEEEIPQDSPLRLFAVDETGNRYIVVSDDLTYFPEKRGVATVYDGETNLPVATIPTVSPGEIAVDPVTHRLFLHGSRRDTPTAVEREFLSVIDLDAGKTEAEVPLPHQDPSLRGMFVDTEAARVYVYHGDHYHVLEEATRAFTASVPTPELHGRIRFSSERRRIVEDSPVLPPFPVVGTRENLSLYDIGTVEQLSTLRIAGYSAATVIDPRTGLLYAWNPPAKRVYESDEESASDTTPPTVTLRFDPPLSAAGWSKGPVNLILHAEDQGSGLQFVGATCEGIKTGSYAESFTSDTVNLPVCGGTMTYAAVDGAGNEVSKEVGFNVGFDNTPPLTSLTYERTPEGALQVRITAKDEWITGVPYPPPYSDVAETRYSVDGGPFASHTFDISNATNNGEPPAHTTGPISLSGDTRHTVRFYSVDFADNAEEIRTVTVPVKAGDVDLDDRVDVEDVIVLLRSLSGYPILNDLQKSVGDLSADGVLDVSDAVLILKVIVGLGG